MPGKNVIKIYVEDGYYHVYNRGTDKRIIFKEDIDYKTFLHLLKIYLVIDPAIPFSKKTLQGRVELLAYCLMPNHFHLLIKQKDLTAMTELIRKVCTTYSMYFNYKYHRSGTLFQGKYKAALIDTNTYLLHVSKYIHLNPKKLLSPEKTLLEYPYSSYLNYVGKIYQEWLKTEEINTRLKEEYGQGLTYERFIRSEIDTKTPTLPDNLFLEKPDEPD